jgi:triacylglycerol lipase
MGYSTEQVMLSLSFVSYLGFYETTMGMQTAKRTLDSLKTALKTSPCLKGEWEIVWGPAMYRIPLTLFDENMMFVVQSQSDPSRYVIAIRGTNPVSLTTWIVEDFNVMMQTPWPYGVNTEGRAPKVSLGTARGLQALQEMIPQRKIPGAGLTLYEFIAKQVAAQSEKRLTFSVTGHSLGGALAPTLALWLADTRKTSDNPDSPPWDPNGNAAIEVYSFAGPSPGNADFANYYNSKLKETTRRVWNRLDVVPHGWTKAALARLPELYAPHIAPDIVMRLILRLTLWLSERGNYEHVLAESIALEGGDVVPLLKDYVAQMLYQHSAAYPELYKLNHEIDSAQHFSYNAGLDSFIRDRRSATTPEAQAIDDMDKRRTPARRVRGLSKTLHRIYQLPATIALALMPDARVLSTLHKRSEYFHRHRRVDAVSH